MKQDFFIYNGMKYKSGTKINTAWWDDDSSANDICIFLDYDTESKKYRCRMGSREMFYSESQWNTVVKGTLPSQSASSKNRTHSQLTSGSKTQSKNTNHSSKSNSQENSSDSFDIDPNIFSKHFFQSPAILVMGIILLLVPGCFIYGLFVFALQIVSCIFSARKETRNEKDGTNARKRAEEKIQIEKEREIAIRSQHSDEPWGVRYAIHPCPHCGHYKVRYANFDDKRLSISFWGMASDKIGKNFKCDHCKKMW